MFQTPQRRARLARATAGMDDLGHRDWLDLVLSRSGWTAARWFPGVDIEVTFVPCGAPAEVGGLLGALRRHPAGPSFLVFAAWALQADVVRIGTVLERRCRTYLVNLDQGVVYSLAETVCEVGAESRCHVEIGYRCHLVDTSSWDTTAPTVPDLRDLLWDTVDALAVPALLVGLGPTADRRRALPVRTPTWLCDQAPAAEDAARVTVLAAATAAARPDRVAPMVEAPAP